MRKPASCFVLLAALTGCGPFLLLPGGELAGNAVEAPATWDLLAGVSTVQVETQPEDPYSVNIWVVEMGEVAYIHAGANRSTWVEHLEADPSIRMRVEEDIYSLRAVRVEVQEEFNRFSDAYEAKFGIRPGNENVGEAYLFRLETP